MHKNTNTNSPAMIKIQTNDVPIIVNTEESFIPKQQPVTRGKRRTNDDYQVEQEIKKPKRVTRSRSGASSNNNSFNNVQQDEENNEKSTKRVTRSGSTAKSSNTIPIPIKQTKAKSSNVSFLSATIRNLKIIHIFYLEWYQ